MLYGRAHFQYVSKQRIIKYEPSVMEYPHTSCYRNDYLVKALLLSNVIM